jgi:hypothetical protein
VPLESGLEGFVFPVAGGALKGRVAGQKEKTKVHDQGKSLSHRLAAANAATLALCGLGRKNCGESSKIKRDFVSWSECSSSAREKGRGQLGHSSQNILTFSTEQRTL